jgi:hypothetical protein
MGCVCSTHGKYEKCIHIFNSAACRRIYGRLPYNAWTLEPRVRIPPVACVYICLSSVLLLSCVDIDLVMGRPLSVRFVVAKNNFMWEQDWLYLPSFQDKFIHKEIKLEELITVLWPPLWSGGQSSWLQIRRPGFDSRHYQKKPSGSGMESTQPREYNWGATW